MLTSYTIIEPNALAWLLFSYTGCGLPAVIVWLNASPAIQSHLDHHTLTRDCCCNAALSPPNRIVSNPPLEGVVTAPGHSSSVCCCIFDWGSQPWSLYISPYPWKCGSALPLLSFLSGSLLEQGVPVHFSPPLAVVRVSWSP